MNTPVYKYDLKVTASELVNAGVVQIKDRIKAAITSKEAAFVHAEQEKIQATKKISEALDGFAEMKVAPIVEAFTSAFKLCKGAKKKIIIDAEILYVGPKRIPKVRVSLELQEDNSRGSVPMHEYLYPLNGCVKKAHADLQSKIDSLESIRHELSDLRHQMYHADEHREKIAAQLTLQQLGSSQEGMAISGALAKYLEQAFTSTPALKGSDHAE